MTITRALALSFILAARASAGCGLDAYQSKIAQAKAAGEGLNMNGSGLTYASSRQVAGVALLQGLAAAGDALDAIHYQEVADNIDEAQRLSPAELKRLTDRNGALFHTTLLLNSQHKDPRHVYTVREVARAVQKAVSAGGLCRPDGSLAVTSDFRDVLAQELKK